jgi:hypothetical protein
LSGSKTASAQVVAMCAPRSLLTSLLLASGTTLACNGNDVSGPTGATLEVTVSTTGAEPDVDGYTVQVDAENARAVQPAGTIQARNIPPGDHTIYVGGVADNCIVNGANPRSVSVPVEGITTIAIEVVCVARTGSVLVTTRTQGAPPFPNDHAVVVDGTGRAAIDTGIVLIKSVTPGTHVIQLTGLSSQCSAQQNPTTVSVEVDAVTSVEFQVICVGLHGTLEISTAPSGYQNPEDFALTIDGGPVRRLGSASYFTIANIAAGPHTVQLLDIPPNCTVLGDNPSLVTVPPGGRGRVGFDVFCDPFPPGSIRLSVTTTGVSPDEDGYTIFGDFGPELVTPPNGQVIISDLMPTNYYVGLSGIAPNCSVQGDNPRLVEVLIGSTLDLAFTVTCTAPADQ